MAKSLLKVSGFQMSEGLALASQGGEGTGSRSEYPVPVSSDTNWLQSRRAEAGGFLRSGGLASASQGGEGTAGSLEVSTRQAKSLRHEACGRGSASGNWGPPARLPCVVGEVLFCEGPAARRPALEPTPSPERPLLTALRQKQILGARGRRASKDRPMQSSYMRVAGRPVSWKVVA